MTDSDHPAAIPPAIPKPGRWRYTDTAIVVIAGLVSSVIAVVVAGLVGFATGADISSGEIPPWQVFWIILPIQFAGQFAALQWVSNRRGTGSVADDFGFHIDLRKWWYVPMGAVALIATGLLAQAVRVILGIGEEDNPQALLDLVGDINGVTVVAVILGLGAAGPIIEELTFRGLLLRTAEERGSGPAFTLIMTAAVFSLVHLTDPALASLEGLPTLVALFSLGLVLGWVTQRDKGNLTAAVFLHCGFNLTSTAALFLSEVAV